MKVLLTGASGFVGAHTAAALIADGHVVRAFVRSRERLDRALAPLGTVVAEVTEGDVTDREAVRRALPGCDALIHAANVYTYSTRYRRELHAVNVGGTEVVLSQAAELGLDPIVYVSSMSRFCRARAGSRRSAPRRHAQPALYRLEAQGRGHRPAVSRLRASR